MTKENHKKDIIIIIFLLTSLNIIKLTILYFTDSFHISRIYGFIISLILTFIITVILIISLLKNKKNLIYLTIPLALFLFNTTTINTLEGIILSLGGFIPISSTTTLLIFFIYLIESISYIGWIIIFLTILLSFSFKLISEKISLKISFHTLLTTFIFVTDIFFLLSSIVSLDRNFTTYKYRHLINFTNILHNFHLIKEPKTSRGILFITIEFIIITIIPIIILFYEKTKNNSKRK